VPRARAVAATTSIETRALVVRRVDYGESDLVITLFTERLGRVSALARGARRSQKRFGGSLEPMHTLSVRLDERAGAELHALREARLDRVRTRLSANLERMEAAGRALGWVRRASPPRTPEPQVWSAVEDLLDRLDDPSAAPAPRKELAEAGLRLLSAFGWGLDLERCVACGKACPAGQAALIDVERGGLVCRSCGGARVRVAGPTRARLIEAAAGRSGALENGDLEVAVDLTDRAFRAHLGFD
jgi:DNA repair protein RecO (recombination protein O)